MLSRRLGSCWGAARRVWLRGGREEEVTLLQTSGQGLEFEFGAGEEVTRKARVKGQRVKRSK